MEGHSRQGIRTVVDAHVHIHDCFDFEGFLDAAARNFAHNAPANISGALEVYVLCLAEAKGADKFGELSRQADASGIDSQGLNTGWRFHRTIEELSVNASHEVFGNIVIVAGRQVVTQERLEVLVLGSISKWEDGLPAPDVVDLANREGAIPVLPWGFGKWIGSRGRAVEGLVNRFSDGSLFLGDNSGRPRIFARPSQFSLADKIGLRILRGTDPLPFRSEYNRAGSFGFGVDDVMVHRGVWEGLRSRLKQSGVTLHNYGCLESPYRFLRNQIAMQFLTRAQKLNRAS